MLFPTAHLEPRRAGPLRTLACWLVLLGLSGCTTVANLPKVDLSDPGWTVWNGQARWQPGAGKPALGGELIVARNTAGDVLVIFAKPPFPIFTAQTAGRLWKVDFLQGGQSYSGRGSPPQRFVWFRVPGIIEGASAPEGWEVEALGSREWSLAKPGTGESLWLVLDP